MRPVYSCAEHGTSITQRASHTVPGAFLDCGGDDIHTDEQFFCNDALNTDGASRVLGSSAQ